MDRLRGPLGYGNIYRREQFGKTIIQPKALLLGFETRGSNRGLLIDRMQRGVNDRLFSIPAENLIAQLKAFSKRGGAKLHHRASSAQAPDDGVIALGLTCFGHDKMTNNVWRPKQPWLKQAPPEVTTAPPKRGYRISHDDRKKNRLVFNSRLNMWVRS